MRIGTRERSQFGTQDDPVNNPGVQNNYSQNKKNIVIKFNSPPMQLFSQIYQKQVRTI